MTLAIPAYLSDSAELIEAKEFWEARQTLSAIKATARARYVGPWATLGNVLANASASTGAGLSLPPIVGGRGSINQFVGIVAPSGGGKGASTATADAAVRFVNTAGMDVETPRFPLGSGEGITRIFQPRGDDAPPVTRAILDVPEVDTIAQLGGRAGATVTGELRKAWSGETLGFANASTETNTRVPAHTYRLCMVVGIQPLRASALLQDSDGGTPQRYLWMPANDPGAVLSTISAVPDQITVTVPIIDTVNGHTMAVPQPVASEIRTVRRSALVADLSASNLSSHGQLARLKAAASLAILDGRADINVDDWELSGVIMKVSDHTRDAVKKIADEADLKEQKARLDQRNQAMEEADFDGAIRHIVRLCEKGILTDKKRMTESEIRRRARSNYRDHIPNALAKARRLGVLTMESVTEGGAVTNYYRRLP